MTTLWWINVRQTDAPEFMRDIKKRYVVEGKLKVGPPQSGEPWGPSTEALMKFNVVGIYEVRDDEQLVLLK